MAALLTVLGLSLAEWKQFGQWISGHAARVHDVARTGINAVLGFVNRFAPAIPERLNEPVEKPVRAPRKAKKTAAPKVAAKSPKPKTGRKASAQRQRSLDLVPGEGFDLPPQELLESPPSNRGGDKVNKDSLQKNARMLETVLDDFGVRGEITKVRPGPVVTLYELEPAPGTKTSRVIGLSDDIARSMSAVSVRVAVVPGRNVIGIELPNVDREMVYLRELLGSEPFERTSGKLNLALGKDIGGVPVTVDLARMPHLLIAGTTGSGKSVGINTMILSLLYQMGPDTCKFIMIDPKMLELSVYEGIPHLLTPVVTEPAKAVMALKWAVREMEDRYRAMSQLGVRNIAGYNNRLAEAVKKGEELTRRVQTGFDDDGKPVMEDQPLSMEPLPFIVVVVDEMADLMLVAGKDIEAAVQRLAQMARAAGIHMIMATQRPSVDVITGTIKANFPTRISFQVTSKIDSRTILGEQGAEQLLGQGDMLYMAGGGRVTRVHGPFVSDEEVEHVVSHLRAQAAPDYITEVTEDVEDAAPLSGGSGRQTGDELYDEAVALIAREGKASTSFIQRHLQIGYNRAARIIEQMESEGVVSKANRVGRREVLIGNVGEAVL
ncbi:MAG: DNA translocase FtsK [Rhodospirillaceae bacterium]|nr:DNA translocase FtsK [Rhodospirillaceae bacterium]